MRLTNDSDSGQEKFRLAWDKATGGDVEAYVPPGESRVVKVPRPPGDPNPTLRLKGDTHEFDNALYLSPRPKEELSVIFLGPDTAEPDGLRYYVARLGNVLNLQIGMIVMAWVAPQEEIGLFAAASVLISRVMVIPDSIIFRIMRLRRSCSLSVGGTGK